MKAILKSAVCSAAVLLLGAGLASAQQVVNLTAGPTTATLPDGVSVPMWGYTCLPAATGCVNTQPSGWSPVVITVPTGQDLTINLTNNLNFNGNKIPTSVVIVGQIGGGLGDAPKRTISPLHDHQGTTWPIANTGPVFTPPSQLDRVQSFSTEVAAGATTLLTWSKPAPGTYLLESGTHPSIQAAMGLVGMVVVTSAPGSSRGLAYTGVNYDAEVPLIFSEIDPAQNNAVDAAVKTVGFEESATRSWSTKGQGVASINILNPGSGYTVAPTVTFSPSDTTAHTATATAKIDTDSTSPTFGQVTEIDIANPGSYLSAPSISLTAPGGSGTTATANTALALNANSASLCASTTSSSGSAAACYPSVVNYSPRYYLINGQGFDLFNSSASLFPTSPATGLTPVTGNVLVRMVNAGLRMHVPSVVGSQTGTVVSPAVPPSGFSLIAEDGNVLPGTPRVQSEVFMAAGKTYDVMINVPATGSLALPVFDRELSLSANSASRDAGMVGYISINGAALPSFGPSTTGATANPNQYQVYADQPYSVTDASKGVLGDDINVYNAKVSVAPQNGTLSLNLDGTFTYTPNITPPWTGDSFNYCGNGGTACAPVTLTVLAKEAAGSVSCGASSFTSNLAKTIKSNAPGVLAGCLNDGAGFPLNVSQDPIKKPSSADGLTNLTVDANGAFSAASPGAGIYHFTFYPQNSQGVVAATATTVTVTFPQGSGLVVKVLDGNDKTTNIGDYRWVIEEDRTFFVDPKCALNPTGPDSTGATCPTQVVNFGTNFHTSYMPVVATGCTGDVSCENNQSVNGTTVNPQAISMPGDVPMCKDVPAGVGCLDPSKRYYISVLPGDAAQPFIGGYGGSPAGCSSNTGNTLAATKNWTTSCGHGMGGAPIAKLAANASYSGQSITVLTEPSPYPPATLTVFVFEDDFPLNGEHDAGGGIDILSPNEPGLGGFQITLQDDAGGTGDATGTPTYDMFNMPLSNSLAGTVDPTTGADACPLSPQVTDNMSGDGTQKGIVGMIITCPKYEADGKTLSPLAGQAVVKNLYAGRYGVVAQPGADRIARGEEWLQTNTLDGQKAHDSFMRIGEPGYFQEFGPAGYHVTIGFANPKIINDHRTALCDPTAHPKADCTHEVKGHVTTARMSRTPDERLYGSGDHSSYSFTQCYVSIGDPDGEEFGFTKCDADGNFDFTNVPAGNWKITTFDQWNDQVVDGISTAVAMCDPQSSLSGQPVTNCVGTDGKGNVDMGEMAVHQWQANISTRTFLDINGDGVSNADASGNPTEPGLPLAATNIRFRDGSFSNFNNTDLNGFAGFNEVFPLFNWYVIETDSTRFKNTGTHVVYDSGGPVDGSSPNGKACATASPTDPLAPKPCGNSGIAASLANTYEPYPLPAELSLPGSVYCADADCTAEIVPNTSGAAGIGAGPVPSSTTKHSTGRIDGPWVNSYGWQGYSGQNNFLEFGKAPFVAGENGGIHGHVVYASTRPFDDPQLLLQTSWEPLVPNVTINLYQETVATDGITPVLKLVDHTKSSSWDDWAQGFRIDPSTGLPLSDGKGGYVPNISCPGQADASDPFYYGLAGQPSYLDLYENPGVTPKAISNSARYKCYDGMHNWNQLQPAPYDGMYSFPSVTAMDPATGKPKGTNCAICVSDPDKNDPYRYSAATGIWTPAHGGAPMLPDGKYVVEVVVPTGYELVKEEDKNILIGDNYIAPVTQQFGGLGSIFILPDQAEINAAYNANNPQNPTNSLGRNPSLPSHEGDTGSIETYWPCVGEMRTVPDFISLFPGSSEVAPFAGAVRPLCDRKEVTLTDQTAALTKFYVFTETHTASHYTGVITDDFTAEFDPFSPQFGEKFGPAYLPISFKDWAGNEIERVYSDEWGAYNGLNYSTWEVNPPNPTGYGPTMMVGCMNDAGPVPDGKGGQMTDPLYQSGYSQFCYELPFMPAQTGYFDTPVVPTSAFAGSYNPPDCAYPAATPAIAEVDGDGVGPWVGGASGSGALSAVNLTLNYPTTGTPTGSGSGYTSAPAVHFSSGNATATAIISGSVTAINFNPATGGGNGYTSIPVVNLEGGGGSGATAIATITGKVSAVTVNAQGGGYTSRPGVTLTAVAGDSGTGAAAATTLSVFAVNVTNGGKGYHTTPPNAVSVTFSNPGGGGVRATGTVQLGLGGVVTGITITNHGSGYTSFPTATINGTHTGPGNSAASITTTAMVSGINVTSGGSGYSNAPTVAIAAPPAGGTQATASASITSVVNSVTLTANGTGYTTAPQVQILPLDGNGSGAVATSTITGSVVAVVLDNPGNGYSTAPTVSFSGGGGSLAAATASLSSGKLTITALGDQQVDNYEYSGPLATGNFNKLRVTRHYGFGATQGTGSVTIGNVNAPVTSWADGSITVTVPAGVPPCPLQQQAIYGGPPANSPARCGQLAITAGNGKQSIDSVTVTLGGKSPTHVAASSTIQAAIDAAAPGDLIIVDPTCTTTPCTTNSTKTIAAHQEMLLMWKPVRLQGVGAASTIIDANPHPGGRLDPWRREVVCLFGLALNGQSYPKTNAGNNNPFDSTNTFTCPGNLQHFSGGPNYPTMVVDRVPMEGILGWDTTVNGNLAEQLIEPSLMGAYEGAGITVLAKGVFIPAGATDLFGSGAEAAFPTGSRPLTSSDCSTAPSGGDILYPSNFLCNPSSIDGLTVKNSSQGGGGIYVHAWAHGLQIANNRILNNQGTMSGGITIGQGEHTDVPLVGGGVATIPPGSCLPDPGTPANLALPYCYDLDVNVHNNMVSQNSSLGDELFSSTPAGAGGITFCNGSDYYKFDYNWVCGNMSTGDGAGVGHVGFSYYGSIEHNTILFNQTTNPSIVTNGGGLLIMGAPDPDPPCATNDQDCVSPANSVTPSDGTGPGLLINANYLVGNSADAGSGGGLRFQNVNGTDVVNFPNGNNHTTWPNIPGHTPLAQQAFQANSPWNGINVINNIIANNVAGWDGGGVSLMDALNVNFVNNTVASNNTTASSGVLFQTLFAPLASTSGTNCTNQPGTQSCPQPSGLVSVTNSAVFSANLPSGVVCPAGHGTTATSTQAASCTLYSVPELYNDLFWQNRSMIIGVGGNAGGLQNQQNMITVYDPGFTGTGLSPTQLTLNQKSTGDCLNGPFSYWDIGVRGDTGPGSQKLAPFYSVLTNSGTLDEGTGGTNNVHPSTVPVASTYCNGSRTPPESGGSSWQVPPGTNESNALPAPPFTLQAGGTVDEGNNWINLSWGPLALSMPDATTPYALDATPQAPAINAVPTTSTQGLAAPPFDFYNNPRKQGNNPVDIGAIEFVAPTIPIVSVSPTSLTFGSTLVGSTATAQALTLSNTGGASFTGITLAFSGPFSRPAAGGTCTGTLAASATCTINVVFTPTAVGPATGSLAITGNATVTGSPVGLKGTGAAVTRTATVTPSPLAFGNWAIGTTSSSLALTVTNTGNTALAGGTFTFGGGTALFSRPAGAAGGNCGAALAVGASCTINVRFAPTATGAVTRTLTVVYTGATVTGSPVNLTGTGVATRATVSITPNPLTVTLPSGTLSGSGTVTLTNTAATGGSSVSITNVAVTGAGVIWLWSKGTDGCTGTNLAPGQSCTVQATFSRLGSVGTHTGAITFTDTGTGSPQPGVLTGIAQ